MGGAVAQAVKWLARTTVPSPARSLLLWRIALGSRREPSQQIGRQRSPGWRSRLGRGGSRAHGRRRHRSGTRRLDTTGKTGSARRLGTRRRRCRGWGRTRPRGVVQANIDVSIRSSEGDSIPRDVLHGSAGNRVAQPIATNTLGDRVLEVRDRCILPHDDTIQVGLGENDRGRSRRGRSCRSLGSGRAEEVTGRDDRIALRRQWRFRVRVSRLRGLGGGGTRPHGRRGRPRRARSPHHQNDEQGRRGQQNRIADEKALRHGSASACQDVARQRDRRQDLLGLAHVHHP